MAEEEQVVTTPANTTEVERIIDKYSGKIYEQFMELVEVSKGPAEELFNMLVYKKQIEGLFYFLPLIITIILIIISFKIYRYWDNLSEEEEYDKGEMVGGIFAAVIVLFVIGVIVTFCTIKTAVMYLMFPEWYVILDLIDMIS
jgi:phosphoglycerol transferase MdoB-like AlkP superfamily enzyme